MKTKKIDIRLRFFLLIWLLILHTLSSCVHSGQKMVPSPSNNVAPFPPTRQAACQRGKMTTLERREVQMRDQANMERCRLLQKPWYKDKKKIFAVVCGCCLLTGCLFGGGILLYMLFPRNPESAGNNQTAVTPPVIAPNSTTIAPTTSKEFITQDQILRWEKNPIMKLDANATTLLKNSPTKESVIQLFNQGVNLYASDKNNMNLLHWAAGTNKLSILSWLSNSLIKWNPTQQDTSGATPLITFLINAYNKYNTSDDDIEEGIRIIIEQAKISPCVKKSYRGTFQPPSYYAKKERGKSFLRKAEAECEKRESKN